MLAAEIPFIEIHLSNVHGRESFRRRSFFSDIAVGCIVVVAVAYLAGLPWLFDWLRPLPEAARVAVSIALVAPLAFFMGMPFPLGLARVAANAPALVPWAWAINGCASVIAAVLATLLAVHWGFTVVVALALALYVAAAAFAPRSR